jgi:acetyl-CoA carboxylase carboxyltransferase component
MQPLPTRIDPQSAAYRENRAAMEALVAELEGHLEKSRFQGSEGRIARARRDEQLLASERVRLLLDKDSPFLELLPLAGLGIRGGFGPGGTVIAGIGLVAGRLTMVSASVGTHKGGSVDYASAFKNVRVNEITIENGLPCVQLVESGGANLPDQYQMFNLAGSHFREMTRRSREGLTTVSVVFGNATAGGAYVPGMSDHAVLVRGKAKVFLAGPPLLKMATNEIATEEELGGAEMHSRVSGVSDYLAGDERDGIRLAREIIGTLAPPEPHFRPEGPIDEPLHDPDELLGIVQADIKKPFDAREVIARVTDGSRFLEFKPEYGPTMVCGWAEIHGYPVGILANNGVLFSESANKATQFIQLCNRENKPLVYLQNITGFMVGKAYEQGGIIKHGSHLINAVSNSDVPTVTINMAASYGAGNYAMNGRSYQPRFLFSYPNSRVSVMGSEQIAGVMEIIQRAKAEREGVPFDEQQFAMIKAMITKENDEKSSAWYGTGQLWDEGVIDPRQTRNVLAICLAVFHERPIRGSRSWGVFRM